MLSSSGTSRSSDSEPPRYISQPTQRPKITEIYVVSNFQSFVSGIIPSSQKSDAINADEEFNTNDIDNEAKTESACMMFIFVEACVAALIMFISSSMRKVWKRWYWIRILICISKLYTNHIKPSASYFDHFIFFNALPHFCSQTRSRHSKN